jgi:hypothetical protein
MKFYETHYEEYLKSVEEYDIHPEIGEKTEIGENKMIGYKTNSNNPTKINKFNNLILYGAQGIGKYSQALKIIKKYSPSELKYEKKITVKTDKQEYQYKISDIHYEIDMAFLGCNSKILWHEIYFQIVDIVSVKTDKIGIIICKNFHKINSELLDIFYSYIQHFNTRITTIQIKFILLTEHISFIPSNILNVCEIIGIKRPIKEAYYKISNSKQPNETSQIIDKVELENIINLKEIYSFSLVKKVEGLPEDIFNTVCDQIIKEIENYNELNFLKLREVLYDILVYNLDATECLWYILSYFIELGILEKSQISDIIERTYSFLKYYNNNYRPIYHLESIIYYIINKLYVK